MVASVAGLGWLEGWRLFGVPAAGVPFLDLRTVQGALASLDLGLDPRLLNPGDVQGRPMNYPLIWLALAELCGLRGETAFLLFGGGMVALFLCCAGDLLRRYRSLFLLAALLSNAPLLLIERGNNDLLVFVLLYGLATVRWWAGGLVFLPAAVVFKLYPVFALLAVALRRPPGYFLCALLLAGGALALLAGELALIGQATPRSVGMSYGWPGTLAMTRSSPFAGMVFSLLLVLLAAATGYVVTRRGPAPAGDPGTDALFLVGASVYCGSYLVAANWDYRLAMLIFCVPALARGEVGSPRIARWLLVALLLAMNVQWLHYFKSTLAGAIADWMETDSLDWVLWFRVPFFAFDHTVKAALFGGLAGVLGARVLARWQTLRSGDRRFAAQRVGL